MLCRKLTLEYGRESEGAFVENGNRARNPGRTVRRNGRGQACDVAICEERRAGGLGLWVFGLGRITELSTFGSRFGYDVRMTTAERITEMIRRLPPPVQEEVLEFAESLARKRARAERDWNGFSLDQAMRGIEDDDMPEYGEADLKEKWA